MEVGDQLRLRQAEQVMVALQRLLRLSRQVPPVVLLRQALALQQGAVRPVEQEDAVSQQAGQSGADVHGGAAFADGSASKPPPVLCVMKCA